MTRYWMITYTYWVIKHDKDGRSIQGSLGTTTEIRTEHPIKFLANSQINLNKFLSARNPLSMENAVEGILFAMEVTEEYLTLSELQGDFLPVRGD